MNKDISMSKLRNAFQSIEGGLFSDVEKADVGSNYEELGRQGVDLMGWADPFYPDDSLPDHIKDACISALNAPISAHYTQPIGNSELKKEIAKKLKEKNHLEVDPDRHILITPGSDSGLYYAMLSCVNERDEVIIPTPTYPNNIQNVHLLHCIPRFVELKEEEHYQINIKDFDKVLSDKTKLVVLTHPNNPTTTVFNEQSLKDLCQFIIDHDLLLVCDQAFEDFIYEGDYITPASFKGMFERTITIFSTSKGMGLSGLRVGYIVACDQIMDTYYGSAVSILGATSTMAQMATLAAFREPQFMDEYKKIFKERNDYAYKLFNSIPHVSMARSESGFMGWINVSQLGDSSDLVDYLIKDAKVCVNDGKNYGLGGEGHLRVILGVYKDSQKVYDALHRMKLSLMKYRP